MKLDMSAFNTSRDQNQMEVGNDNGAKKREPLAIAPIKLASLFTERFYSKMKTSRESMFQFFADDSYLVSGYHGEKAKVCSGQEEIHQRFQEPDYKVTFTDIFCVDALGAANGQVMVQATGLFETIDGAQRSFYESFILAPQHGGGYYVLVNIRRIAREAARQTEAAPPVALTPKAASTPFITPKPVQVQDVLQKDEVIKPKTTQGAFVISPPSACAIPAESYMATPPALSDPENRQGDSKRLSKVLNETVNSTKRGGVPTPAPEVAKPAAAVEASPASDSTKKPVKAAEAASITKAATSAPQAAPAPQSAPVTKPSPSHPSSAPMSSSSVATAPAATVQSAPRTWASAAANNANASWDKKNIAEVKGTSARPQSPPKISPPTSAHGRPRNDDISCAVHLKGVSLDTGTTRQHLIDAFTPFGEVASVDFSKFGGAFISFLDANSAKAATQRAITLPNGATVKAEPKRDTRGPRPPHVSGMGRGGGPRGQGQSGRGDRGGNRRRY